MRCWLWLEAVQCLGGQLAQSHQLLPVAGADDLALYQVQIAHRHPRQLMGIGQDPLLEQLAGLADGKAADVGLAGGVGAQSRMG